VVEQFAEVAEGEQAEAYARLVDLDPQVQCGEFELKGAAVGFVSQRVGQLRKVLDPIDLVFDLNGARKFDDELVAVVGQALMKARITGHGFVVQSEHFRGEDVILGILRALVDAYLQVKVRRLDPSGAVFTAVVKFPTFVAEQTADVIVELVCAILHFRLTGFADKILGRIALAVGHVMVLLKAFESAHATGHSAENTAVGTGGCGCV